MSNSVGSSSPDLREAASWLDEWHHHLLPEGSAGVSIMVGGGVAGVDLLIGEAGWVIVAKRVAKGTFPVSNCKGTGVPPAFCGAGL